MRWHATEQYFADLHTEHVLRASGAAQASQLADVVAMRRKNRDLAIASIRDANLLALLASAGLAAVAAAAVVAKNLRLTAQFSR